MGEIIIKTKAVAKTPGEEGFCVRSMDVFLAGAKKDKKERWIADHDLWTADIAGSIRVITPVIVAQKLYWMDAVTGTIYNANGWCATSGTLSIKDGSIVKNNEFAVNFLMSLKEVAE